MLVENQHHALNFYWDILLGRFGFKSLKDKIKSINNFYTSWWVLNLKMLTTEADEMPKESIWISLPEYYTFISNTSFGCIYTH